MTFDAKETLYRSADVLSVTNYERFLLDYVDNELSAVQKRELETLISQHPHIQKDLSLLKAARLTPDLSVTFENKASLYRKERTKVRPLWWWSAAAAVVVGLTVWLLPGQRSGEGAQVAVNQPASTGNSPAAQRDDSQRTTAPSLADAGRAAGSSSGAPSKMTAAEENRETGTESRISRSAIGKTPSGNVIAQSDTDSRINKRSASDATVTEPKQAAGIDRVPDNRLPVLAKIPQPASTSVEVVQRLQEKTEQQEKILAENITVVPEKTAVMANAEKISDAIPAAAAPANVKGELVVAVTMNGDSKLLNGVANVARFLSRKKK
jgi:hypothetical protein